MKRYLVTIEFRYKDAPKFERDSEHKSKTATIGVFESFSDACAAGNRQLERLEDIFPLHVFPDGRKAERDRFSKNGGPFGTKKNLVTNSAYLKTPFEFYAKITELQYIDTEEMVNMVLEARERWEAVNLDNN